MSRIYIYPKEDYSTLESPNPYVEKTEKILETRHRIVNKKPNNWVLNMVYYLFKTDIYFFNWIENLSMKRFGKIQSILFFVFIHIAKSLGKRLVWVMHNLYSHESYNRKWTKALFTLMVRKSDLIITHSGEGVSFMKRQFPSEAHKIRYFIHPIDHLMIKECGTQQKDITFLIWGTVHPYKGVIEFLNFVKNSTLAPEINVTISGICPDPELKATLLDYVSDRVNYIDKFATMEEISILAGKSDYILFTYNSASVLSSGSLMDSIRMGSTIIGPDKGAFHDLKDQPFIHTYTEYSDITRIYYQNKDKKAAKPEAFTKFQTENSWNKYGQKLLNAIVNIT